MPQNIELFAYLNIEHPMVAWEVAIGRMKSSCDNIKDNFGISLWQYNLLKKYSNTGEYKKIINELKLERMRQRKYSNHVSRLRGLYFFESEEDAKSALDRWNMPQRKKYISAVNFSANSVTKVDSEWITWNLLSENTDWMERYWSGEIYGEKPLYEYLASGFGVIQNKDLRTQAYKRIMDAWPTSTPLLASACCAFKHKRMEEIALLTPALTRENDRLLGSYFINMEDLNNREQEVATAVGICNECNETPPMILPENPNDFFSLPDFRSDCFEFKDTEAQALYEQIHKS